MLARSIGQMGSAMLVQNPDDSLRECAMDLQLYLFDLANATDWAVRSEWFSVCVFGVTDDCLQVTVSVDWALSTSI